MLRIDASEKRLVAVQQLSLETASVADRFDLSELIANSPEEFFGSIGQDLFVVGRAFHQRTPRS